MSNDNGNNVNNMTVPTMEDLKKKLTSLKEKLAEEFPHHCRHCGGNGGYAIHYPGSRWEPDFYEFEYCEYCAGSDKDPLNIHLPLGEGDISPTTGEGIGDAPLLNEIRLAEEAVDYHPYGEDDN